MRDFFAFTPETTIALCGGSGFLGKYVVQRLAKAGLRIRIITRTIKDARPLMALGNVGQIAYVPADLRTPYGIERVLEGCHACINLIGILYEKGPATFNIIHRELPRQLAARAHSLGLSRFIHVSALGANIHSNSRYSASKAEGEKEVCKAFPKATIIRPSILFGPEDDFFNRFGRLAKLLPILPVVGGSSLMQPVYVDDVAQAVAQSLIHPQASGLIYEIGGPKRASFNHLLSSLLKWIDRPKPIINLPLPLARLLGMIGQLFPIPPLTVDQVLLLQKDNIVSGHLPGLEQLGITPTPMETIVPSYVSYLRPPLGK